MPLGDAQAAAAKEERTKLYLAQAGEVRKAYPALLKHPNWKPLAYDKDPSIACYELPDDGTGCYTLKAECIVRVGNPLAPVAFIA